MEKGINKDTLVSFLKLHTFQPQQEGEGSKQMKAELWTPGREVEEEGEKEVEETDSGGGDQWHFQNALFDDIKSSLKGGKSSSSNSSMSRRRYACLACGEVKRWDQLTQHYKKMVQWDSMGIPAVPDQKGMGEKVYQHTALFFEKNFSKDKMPTYRDHTPADGPLPEEKPPTPAISKVENVQEFGSGGELGTGSTKPETKLGFDRFPFQSFLEQQASLASMAFQVPGRSGVAENIFNGAGGAFKKEVKEPVVEKEKTTDNVEETDANNSLDAIDDTVTVKDELMPLCNSSPMFFSPFSLPPRIPLPPPPLHKRPRKRKLPPSSSVTSSTPSQSRRFYKCLGCGSSKRWDRLTDHYRKYVVFGPLGQPWVPNLETMTPEQYVHTLAFRDQGFSSDRMPQYRDHAEASQDLDDEFGMAEEGQDNIGGFNDDSQELLAGPVHHTRDSSETVDDSVEVVKKYAKETETLPEAPPLEAEKPKPSPHPNMKVFWDSKTFADVKIICDGGVVTAHKLILAASNAFFHQVLVDCVDEDFSIIVMPDHSFDDVSAMIQGFYDFKVSRNLFPFNSEKLVSNQNDDSGNEVDHACPKPCKVTKMNSVAEPANFSTNILPEDQFSDSAGSLTDDPGEVSEHRTTTAGSDTLDRLIQKEGSPLCPTYSCKIPGCKFSVQNSLMCIKGHILTEHWGNLG